MLRISSNSVTLRFPSQQAVYRQPKPRPQHRASLDLQRFRFGMEADPKIIEIFKFLHTPFKTDQGTIRAGDMLYSLFNMFEKADSKPGKQHNNAYMDAMMVLGISDAETRGQLAMEFCKRGLFDYDKQRAPFFQMEMTGLGMQVSHFWKASQDSLPVQQVEQPAEEAEEPKKLPPFITDLTALAKAGKLPAFIGREKEIDEMRDIFRQTYKRNPLLIGDKGVGKTSLVAGFAQRVARGDFPELKGKKVVMIDIPGIVAGTKYRGQFEERARKLLDYLQKNPDVIAFMDEFHMVLDAGGAEGGVTLANILKPYLDKESSQMIAATTFDDIRRLERDSALKSRFDSVHVWPPDEEDMVRILHGIVEEDLTAKNGVSYSPEILRAIVKLGRQYVHDEDDPRRAKDLVDKVGAQASKRGSSQASMEDVLAAVSRKSKVPIQNLTTDIRDHLLNLEDTLHQRVIGQDNAVKAVTNAIVKRVYGLSGEGPMASMIFMGPTGVGKSELAKALAAWMKVMTGQDDNLIRLDMGEYMERHSVSRLIGSPPGYVAYEEGGQLTGAIRRRPYSVVLLDEIEKAHPEVINKVLLPLISEGRLTDGKGKTVNARNTIIIMTSNIAAEEVARLQRTGRIGLGPQQKRQLDTEEQIKAAQHDGLRQLFKPEFLNRVDEIINFQSLTNEEQIQVVELHLANYTKRLQAEERITLNFDDRAKQFLRDELFRQDGPARHRQGGRLATDIIERCVNGPFAWARLRENVGKDEQATFAVTYDPKMNMLSFGLIHREPYVSPPIAPARKGKQTQPLLLTDGKGR